MACAGNGGVLVVFLVCAYLASEEELLGETVFFVSAAFISCYLVLLFCILREGQGCAADAGSRLSCRARRAYVLIMM